MVDVKAVLSTVNIVDVLRRSGVTLKNNKTCCPFHSEKTPSFSIHPKKNIFKCFGCGAGGDSIEFVKRYHNTDFIGALKWLNDNFSLGLTFDRATKETTQTKETRIDRSISNTLSKFYSERFKRSELALNAYFRNLHQIIVTFIPPPDADICDFPETYIEAVNNIDRIEHYCNLMMNGNFEDKKEVINIEEVKKIERDFYNQQ